MRWDALAARLLELGVRVTLVPTQRERPSLRRPSATLFAIRDPRSAMGRNSARNEVQCWIATAHQKKKSADRVAGKRSGNGGADSIHGRQRQGSKTFPVSAAQTRVARLTPVACRPTSGCRAAGSDCQSRGTTFLHSNPASWSRGAPKRRKRDSARRSRSTSARSRFLTAEVSGG